MRCNHLPPNFAALLCSCWSRLGDQEGLGRALLAWGLSCCAIQVPAQGWSRGKVRRGQMSKMADPQGCQLGVQGTLWMGAFMQRPSSMAVSGWLGFSHGGWHHPERAFQEPGGSHMAFSNLPLAIMKHQCAPFYGLPVTHYSKLRVQRGHGPHLRTQGIMGGL